MLPSPLCEIVPSTPAVSCIHRRHTSFTFLVETNKIAPHVSCPRAKHACERKAEPYGNGSVVSTCPYCSDTQIENVRSERCIPPIGASGAQRSGFGVPKSLLPTQPRLVFATNATSVASPSHRNIARNIWPLHRIANNGEPKYDSQGLVP